MNSVPYDADLVEPLRVLKELLPDPDGDRFIAELRERAAAGRPTTESLEVGGRVEVDELEVPGADGGAARTVLLLRPAGLAGEALPTVYFMHPGGTVAGDHRTGTGVLLDLVEHLPLQTVSIDYRLAPEQPFPAALQDAEAGLEWLAKNAAELDADAERIVLAGASAGGCIAAGLALALRDRGGPRLCGQMLIAPMLDNRSTAATPSRIAGEGTWDYRANRVAWDALLREHAGHANPPAYAVPARTSDLSGLPPTFLDVGSAELFRDETVSYATALWNAGVEAELHVWPGGFHAFDWSAPYAPLSLLAKAARRRWLSRVLRLDDPDTEKGNA